LTGFFRIYRILKESQKTCGAAANPVNPEKSC
jgi:hypothetical protein